jgi:hypothetical protein
MSSKRTPTVKPRHVLCFLCPRDAFQRLTVELEARGASHGFRVDREFSKAAPDPRLPGSFEVCRDRVAVDGWLQSDASAVARHGAVIYVLSLPMTKATAVDVSTAALALVAFGLKHGATAAKGESAGVAHGAKQWGLLARRSAGAKAQGDLLAMSRHARVAFAKRPLESSDYYESVGFHLVGLPEVFLTKDLDGLTTALLMDQIANEMVADGVAVALKARGLRLSKESSHPTDSFKFNPFGIAKPRRQ